MPVTGTASGSPFFVRRVDAAPHQLARGFLFAGVFALQSSDASRPDDFSEKHDTSPVASQCGIWTGFRDGHYKCGVTLAFFRCGRSTLPRRPVNLPPLGLSLFLRNRMDGLLYHCRQAGEEKESSHKKAIKESIKALGMSGTDATGRARAIHARAQREPSGEIIKISP